MEKLVYLKPYGSVKNFSKTKVIMINICDLKGFYKAFKSLKIFKFVD